MLSKQCTGCGEVKLIEMFRKDPRGMYGREARCKKCKNAYGKRYREENREKINQFHGEHYKGKYKGRYQGRYRDQNRIRRQRFYEANPTAKQAQNAIWTEVRAGRIPKARTIPCSRCGKQAAHYHHHLGYAPEHWLDVIPLCHGCHRLAHEGSWK